MLKTSLRMIFITALLLSYGCSQKGEDTENYVFSAVGALSNSATGLSYDCYGVIVQHSIGPSSTCTLSNDTTLTLKEAVGFAPVGGPLSLLLPIGENITAHIVAISTGGASCPSKDEYDAEASGMSSPYLIGTTNFKVESGGNNINVVTNPNSDITIEDCEGAAFRAELPKIVQVAAGGMHACALFDHGKIKCWGSNSFGQLGLGDTETRGDGPGEMGMALPFVDLGDNFFVKKIALGNTHSCALSDAGMVKCWGKGTVGQLGNGTTSGAGATAASMGNTLIAVAQGPFEDITSLMDHSCGVLSNGQMYCWGSGSNKQIGNGSTSNALNPVMVNQSSAFVESVSAGATASCALTDTSSIHCWGSNTFGELGQENMSGVYTSLMSAPAINLGTSEFAVKVTAAKNHICALLGSNEVKCWGLNGFGQLGSGSSTNLGDGVGEMGDNLLAVNLGFSQVEDLVSGGSNSCVILASGALKCWGRGATGALGNGSTANIGVSPGQMGNNLSPIPLGMIAPVTSVGMGFDFTCAVEDERRVKCWGLNSDGQLGLGDTQNRGDGPGEMGPNLPYVRLR